MTEVPPQETMPRWALFADDVLTFAEARRKAAIAAVRKFVGEVNPVLSDRSRRKSVIESRLALAEELVTARIAFRRSVVRRAGQLTARD